MATGNMSETQELGSASKEHDRRKGLGAQVDSNKGKAPMMKQRPRIPQLNLQQDFPLLSSPGNGTYCLPQSQPLAGVNTSKVPEPGSAFHQQHYRQGNILQLEQAVFDMDFDH